jgi:hypothetical protein
MDYIGFEPATAAIVSKPVLYGRSVLVNHYLTPGQDQKEKVMQALENLMCMFQTSLAVNVSVFSHLPTLVYFGEYTTTMFGFISQEYC